MAKPALVLLPEWGSGHLMSMLDSCKRVLLSGDGEAFSITLLVMRPPTAEATSEVESHVRREAASGLDIRFHRLPAVDPPSDAVGVEEFIARYIALHAPHVRDAVAAMSSSCPVAALVLDMFASPLVDVARDLGVPSYVFMSSTGAMLALMLHLPVLHEKVTVEFEEVDGDLEIPGLPPLPPASMPCPVVDKKSPNYTWFLRLGDRFMDATGIIANTTDSLEPGPLAAIAEGRCVPGRTAPPVYPIGPVLSLGDRDRSLAPSHECVAWLDAQPPASVVFLCFGSMGWFEPTQVVEITAALERCDHRFLWVLRGPPSPVSRHPTDADLDELLPEGFLERTEGRGMVWPRWAPQKDILAHPAVGGFVTHGGWNSVLESLWHGVPMAPWPLYAEQHLNAFELVADVGVAVPLRVDRKRDNFVEAAELERAVRTLMGGGDEEEGRRAREKAAEMKAVCREAVAEGGSSHAALRRLAVVLQSGAVIPKGRSESPGASENSRRRRSKSSNPCPSMATPTVVLVPTWGAGHLMSLLEAGKRLLARAGGALSLTVLVMRLPSDFEQLAAEVAGLIRREEASGLDVRFVHLPAVEPPTDTVGIEEFVSRFVQAHAPHVRDAVAALDRPVAALVLDFFCTTLLDVSRDLAVPGYVYFTSDAAMLALMLRLPALHEEVTVEFEEMEGGVDVPGLPPVPPSSLPTPVTDKKNPNYTWFVYHGRRFAETDGIMVNTAAELEPSALAAIAGGRCTRGVRAPVIYTIGPVISFPSPSEQKQTSECVRWLDGQPPKSVVLLCFGSGGFFPAPQAHEVAHGLERSGHRFLWVLRGPPAPGSMQPTDANLSELLPDGFLERTKDRGLVWPTWAPQKEMLAHAAVGGFVTHCGWNSVLESLWHGVPMAPWPLYAEQHLNAFMLVEVMGVAVAMEVDRKRGNFVEAAELERAVKELMGSGEEGRKAREKAVEMKAACRNAVEEGGSSYSALQRLSEELCKGALLDTSN
nr:unnamed protein product [Digitaria exilis]